ncbi:MAG: hypothetical protein Q4F65_07495 [Propionibacteriaceae bacterium]|nr:hypothetical protein [Propionibacteriaceae bacterium]
MSLPRHTADASLSDWLAPRLLPWGATGVPVGAMVPTCYQANVRILHRMEDGRRWHDIATANGRVLHPLAQWAHFFDTLDHPNLWPSEGHLPLPDHHALLAHLAAEGEVTYAVWDGYGFWGGGSIEACNPDQTTYEIPIPNRVPEEASPTLVLPNRSYHLFRAPLAVQEIWLEGQDLEQSANLVWPDDRGWCLATEIDFTFTLLGCTRVVADAVLAEPALESFEVGVDDNMSWAGDTLNPAPGRL